MNSLRHPAPSDRRGNVIVLTAVMMIAFLAMISFAVDIGYLNTTKVELQRTADSAAMAATWELVRSESSPNDAMTTQIANARTKAAQFAAANPVCTAAPVLDANTGNSTSGDIVVGYLASASSSLDTLQLTNANAVQVRVRKTAASSNGNVPLFFARAMGINHTEMSAEATATLTSNFGGFKTPPNGGNLQILPFALDKDTWDDLLAGGGNDQWKATDSPTSDDPFHKNISSGSDGVREVNLYPQSTGSPGNRGTVDIGSSNNSTSDIARQIVDGISADDLNRAPFNGELKFDSNGKLYLNGDTGISAGVKDELASIIGQPRIIPIFEQVQSPGNNATYTIVEFAGVRIMDVSLTGKMSSKRLIVQPAKIVVYGGIPATGTTKSWYVYSPAWLVR
jgi:Flp pilus assembly protein TadG